MPFDYEINPKAIESESFRQIRQLTELDNPDYHYSREEQQVIMRIVHSIGLPHLSNNVRFSQNACQRGLQSLAENHSILCDVEMVKQGVTKRMIQQEPLCFLNDARTAKITAERKGTRTMAALELWQDTLENSVVLIGNAPTALFRLLEMLEEGCPKPALIVGMPVGFVGAAESKQALWDNHQRLGVECITLLGREGGSAVTSATCNALLRCNHGEYY
ncbi:MAG: precorrin-8X methylmutase [Arenicella sp.]